MSIRDYFRSFLTREYWEALGSFLLGMGFAQRQIREDFWERAEEEAETRREQD